MGKLSANIYKISCALLICALAFCISACGGKSYLQETIPTKEYFSAVTDANELKSNLLHAMDEDRIAPIKLEATAKKPLELKAPLAVFIDDNEGNDGFLKSERFQTTDNYDEAESFLFILKNRATDESKGKEKHWYSYAAYLTDPTFSMVYRIGEERDNGTLSYLSEYIDGLGKDSLEVRNAADSAFQDYLLGCLKISGNGGDDVQTVINSYTLITEEGKAAIYEALEQVDADAAECEKHRDKDISSKKKKALLHFDNGDIPETTEAGEYKRKECTAWIENLSEKSFVFVSPEKAAKNIRNGEGNIAIIQEVCGLEPYASYSGIGQVYTRIYRETVIDLASGKVLDWSDRYSTSKPTIGITESEVKQDDYGRQIYQVATYNW